ncbi:MAG: SPOR domain-containing protein [Deltaproteobacteria bacterium]|nr:SPOR domain-containing protein [Deltaproteobacteria bacterium]
MSVIKKFSATARLATLTAGLTLSVGACTGLPVEGEPLGPAEQRQLKSSLNVAAASADAGQTQAAERLYTQLARHYPSAPEPRLGLAYLALGEGDFTLAERLFGEADERSATPAVKAEALLGAGRASLGMGDPAAAKSRFVAASKVAKGTAAEAWVANGLGVVAALDGDHAQARTHYEKAVRLSSSHPKITANLVRALAQSGAAREARQLYSKFPASHWLEGDGEALARLLDERETGAAVASGAKVQLYAARSRKGALAAWKQLAAAEKDLLGALTPRVVKADVAKRGVFYRLRAGPLADKAAARRLCRLLKRRGRDCFVPAGKWPGGKAAERPGSPEIAGKHSGERANARAAKQSAGKQAPGAAGASVQIYSARSHAGALAGWGRLVAMEKDLLDSLTPRVVKADVPKKGVFYGLRVGPFPDRAAARRLCGLLKARGRDCFVPPGK